MNVKEIVHLEYLKFKTIIDISGKVYLVQIMLRLQHQGYYYILLADISVNSRKY